MIVFAEPNNTLIIDRKGFKSAIPGIKGLAPKDNIKACVDRNAFIHNLGYATAAYYGHFLHPDAVYLYEVLNYSEVLLFTRAVMLQSAAILKAAYAGDFTKADLEAHIDDLIYRFRNKALGDTIFQVGQDLPRKLAPNDRFIGIIRLAQKQQKPYDKVLQAMAYAFFFRATDENRNRPASDLLFDNYLSKGIEFTLREVCRFDPERDRQVTSRSRHYFDEIAGTRSFNSRSGQV
ncbi:Mannitol dehydrogenase C-terminal domain-containing protein [Mariniphaga anaerophila]|uniref:Mannitol dehydrogenase C-terminal domain-containing protein n=1 Tax=Mariniphaga anaerophila TaxID=1484053 RepID=A0A1M4UD75_9BACT|nr:hypothetical protein [Mariniphaga anaerophila]SHE54689.1 Mannitol dehydrogenase C-terminal domain-containing protein [Mariniphaga anaerophila]